MNNRLPNSADATGVFPRRKGLRLKMALVIGGVVALITVLLFTAAASRSFVAIRRSLELRAHTLVEVQARALSRPLWDLDSTLVEQILEAFTSDPDFARAEVFNDQGQSYARIGTVEDVTNLVVAEVGINYQLGSEAKNIGKVKLYLSSKSITQGYYQELVIEFGFLMVMIAVLTLTLMRGLRFVTRPIVEISNAMACFAAGEINVEPKIIDSKDEIGNLSRTFASMVTEITNFRRELERKVEDRTRELAEAKVQAEEANRVKSTFLAHMSHEFRTPLNGVLGIAQVVQNDTTLSPSQQQYIGMIQDSAQSLLGLLNDVLDISKIEAGKLSPEILSCELRPLLREVISPLGLRAAQKGIELICEVSEQVPTFVEVDPLRLRQVLTNLMANSIKFTERGEVVLSLYVRGDSELHFEVCDTGVGIPESALPKLFNAFTQADQSTTRKFGGTGLGLAISKSLIELMAGHIEVTSVLGEGTCFHFVLPFAVTSKAQPKESKLQGKTVVVVADNEALADVISRELRSKQVELLLGNSIDEISEKAVAKASASNEVIFIVDANHREFNSFESIQSLSQSVRFSKILILLSTTRLGEFERFLVHGAGAVLPKPFLPETLVAALEYLFGVGKNAPEGLLMQRSASEQRKKTVTQEKPLNILVTDDTKVNRIVAKLMLEQKGHKVTLAQSGSEALQALENMGWFKTDEPSGRTEEFDVLLLDIEMPELDGLATTQMIRKREAAVSYNGLSSRHLPIVAVTAHALAGDKDRFLSAGMDAYITKPILEQTLFDVLGTLTQHRQGVAKNGPEVVSSAQIFDLEELRNRFMNDHEAVKEVIEAFLSEIDGLNQNLLQADISGDKELLRKAAHAIKGSLANVCANEAWRLARDFEDRCKISPESEINLAREELRRSIKQVCEEMRK